MAEDRVSFTLTEETPRDGLGRCRFVLDWTETGGRERGQYFFTNPDEYAKMLRERGHTVTIVRHRAQS